MSTVMRVLVVGALAVASLAWTSGQPEPPRDVSAELEAVRAKNGVPALGGAAIRAGQVVAIGVAGVRRAGGEERVTIDDLWHLGSCTKAMTATLIARLVEQGTLNWETTIGDAFPELKEQMDPAWHAVTIELLLQNRAGAPSDLREGGLWGSLWSDLGTPTQARRALLVGVTKHPPEHEPGSKFLYANAGFAIAGHMAETITRVPWEDLMRREVFGPLGMESAGFGAPGTPDAVDQPRGHRPKEQPVEPGRGADNPVAIGPAGIVHASLGDWAKFIAVHLRGARAEETGYLKTETFARLHTAISDEAPNPDGSPAQTGRQDGYAMGWGVTTRGWAKSRDPDAKDPTGRVLTHAGSNTLWFCVAWLAPERDFAAIATVNIANAKAADEAIQALMRETLPRVYRDR